MRFNRKYIYVDRGIDFFCPLSIRNMKRTSELLKNILFGFLIVVLLLSTLLMISQKKGLFGFSSYTVLSGSMNPAFNTGDIVVVGKMGLISPIIGDIISFYNPGNSGKIITHRVAKVIDQKGQKFFETKGDANKDIDKWTIPEHVILGKVFFSIPKLGYLISSTKTLPGFLLFIILPGIAIIISEILSLSKYITSLEKKAEHVEIKS
ncbi:MAG: Type I signal peptidase [Candidatus Gottesmanbacteria bacterium GW2011_GWC2_39_8]|uniref:Signal peptidase I n=1 Tax=Candidatus Gottesmanbacteria bacterium GW2011_GWC2_39_8 TaxID=1618450 RepID=A0A0G0T1L6_9BACT|nr:MAG: Type I signal peptidase [Candidatus Gottesmanbacteria bacterium GW2011_GWC2_39_8]